MLVIIRAKRSLAMTTVVFVQAFNNLFQLCGPVALSGVVQVGNPLLRLGCSFAGWG